MVLAKSTMAMTIHMEGFFAKLVQNGNYEIIIQELIDKSEILFKNVIRHNKSQSDGEPDFCDVFTGEKYEAKFPIGNRNGEKYFSRKGSMNDFFLAMYRETTEFASCVDGSKKSVEDLELYVHIKEVMDKIETDENAILFIPYPIVPDVENNPLLGSQDMLTKIYTHLKKEGILGTRKMYVVYFSSDDKMVIREMETGIREYFVSEKMKEIINFQCEFF